MKEKKPIYKKWWFWLIVIILLGGIAGGASTSNTTIQTSTSETSIVSNQNTVTPIEIDYNTLYQEYQENPINADAKYKNKLLILTGPIDNIDREIAGNPYVTFHIGNEYSFQDVRLTFKKSEESKVAELSKGQTIKIKGICKGTLLSTTVSLNDCELLEK